MTEQKKILGEERRTLLLEWLKKSRTPLTGTELAKKVNVSRQVIVGDMTLLKARKEPIIATSQGYLYLHTAQADEIFERTVACYHTPQRTEEELNLLVDLGITVKDVKIEHPIYGDLTASIMVSNRKEVRQFIEKVVKTKASYLSVLTKGYHLHTISAASEHALDEAEQALKKHKFLIDTK
ncbi:transcription repressor NadR [Bacillaceae bacterium Marseille-Q3522]|nr:transcription repressor NadR [Bacillaceae bacterium Marseille-Q3522]